MIYLIHFISSVFIILLLVLQYSFPSSVFFFGEGLIELSLIPLLPY